MPKNVQIDGRALASLRGKKFFTQEEVAEALGVAKGTASRYEQSDRVGILSRNFKKLAELFKTTPDDLLGKIGLSGTESRIVLSAELTAKVRDFAARESRDVMEWLRDVIESAEPSPSGRVFDAPIVDVTPPRESRRREGTAREGKAGSTH